MVAEGRVVNYYDNGRGKGALVVGKCETCAVFGLSFFPFPLLRDADSGAYLAAGTRKNSVANRVDADGIAKAL